MIDLGDGRRIKAELSLSGFRVTPYGSFDFEGTAMFDETTGRYAVRRLTIEGRDGAQVTGEVLRAFPVRELLRDALPDFHGSRDPDDAQRLLELGKAGPTTDTLRAVAAVYRLGVAIDDNPAERVARAFSVPRSTAGRWVMRSRDRGFLTVTDPRAPHTSNAGGGIDG